MYETLDRFREALAARDPSRVEWSPNLLSTENHVFKQLLAMKARQIEKAPAPAVPIPAAQVKPQGNAIPIGAK